MNNSELIDYIAKNSTVLKKDAAVAVRLMVEGLRKTLVRGGAVSVSGLGIFAVSRTRARVAYHPKTRLPINVRAKKRIRFQPCEAIKLTVNGG